MERFIRRGAVRLLQVVTKPFVVIFGANIKFGLDWPCLSHNLRDKVSVFEFKWWLVLGKILEGLGASRFQQGNLQACLCQTLASPAA